MTQQPPQGYYDHPKQAINGFATLFNERLAQQIKILLEQKHLYQKVNIDPGAVQQLILEHVKPSERRVVENEILRLCRDRLIPTSGGELRSVPVAGGVETVEVGLIIPNTRLFCTTCNEKSVFRGIWYQDVSNELIRLNRVHEVDLPTGDILTNQLFFIALQCQHCKGLPEGFLIRREDWKFSLDGRSPMEHIESPRYIPKTEAHLFRDAMIAWHAGKNLAAVFYLRCFIEQFARRQTGLLKERKTGDEIMDAYVQVLPNDKRSHLPSLKQWYDRLSEPIHAADEDAAEKLFDDARAEVEHHFELRQALRIAGQ
jgi:hypothetical protein